MYLLTFVYCAIIVATLLGPPAPRGVGATELAVVGLVGVYVALNGNRILQLADRWRQRTDGIYLLVIYLYFLVWVTSGVVGSFKGVGAGSVIRSVAPYTVFLPIPILAILSEQRREIWNFTVPLLVAGACHAALMLYLFGSAEGSYVDLSSVLGARTTFVDSRTTIPLFLGLVFLPLAVVVSGKTVPGRILAISLSLSAVAAALSTQTRSQALAIVVGLAVFVAILPVRLPSSQQSGGDYLRKILVIVVGVSGLFLLAYMFVPVFGLLIEALRYRQALLGDNARLENEWIPALAAWAQSGLHGSLLGIGSGVPFLTANGIERTYIHNMLVYHLVYSGLIGTVVAAAFYWLTWRRLLQAARLTGDAMYVALAALLVAMLAYSQLFAVHKLLSYNMMLSLITLSAFHGYQRGRLVRASDVAPPPSPGPSSRSDLQDRNRW